MTAINLCLNLPDNLAYEAQKYGLLNSETIESLLCAELKRFHVNNLFAAADRLAEIDIPVTESEIEEEIQAVRKEKQFSL